MGWLAVWYFLPSPTSLYTLTAPFTSLPHLFPLPDCLSSDLRHRSSIPYRGRPIRRGHHSEQRALERRGKRLFAGQVQVPPL